jgi:murein endopeptidase
MGRCQIGRLSWLAASCTLAAALTGCSPATVERDTPLDSTAVVEPPPAAKEAPLLRAPKAARGEQVIYNIAHGGSLIDVANLYKIHHHEIARLNPSVAPDLPLPVGSEVVVYRYDREDSESIGLPHDGRLVGAMPFPDGPGRRITAHRWKTWATRATVLELDDLLTKWSKRPGAPPVLVSNLSARAGGPLAPHQTHQSGRDVDLGYVAKPARADNGGWQQMNRENLDAEATWQLLKLLVEPGNVEVIFIDRRLQQALLKYALEHGTVRRSRLAHWLEVAKGARDGGPIVKHVPGHADHFHVRFACPNDEPRCRS